jgi:hypothetical protein
METIRNNGVDYHVVREMGLAPDGSRVVEAAMRGYTGDDMEKYAWARRIIAVRRNGATVSSDTRDELIRKLVPERRGRTAGWLYGSSGVCRPASGPDYPWHEPHHGTCLRCGEIEVRD